MLTPTKNAFCVISVSDLRQNCYLCLPWGDGKIQIKNLLKLFLIVCLGANRGSECVCVYVYMCDSVKWQKSTITFMS